MHLAKKREVELLYFTPLPGIRNSLAANTCEVEQDIPTTPPYLPQICRHFEAMIEVNWPLILNFQLSFLHNSGTFSAV